MVGLKGGRGRLPTGAVAALAAGLVLAGTASGATGDTAGRARPTVVLEHGAFADGSSWGGVIAELRADGYPEVAASHSVAVSRPGLVAGASSGRPAPPSAGTPEIETCVSRAERKGVNGDHPPGAANPQVGALARESLSATAR
ncbi:hypothetical protein ABTX81_19950 [Kitasatospora sp. NPDC097605]|uniref:alpha/beta fold hydrolase n=1 Tax=Kitasatospora sp. NPDC097605 TaxID=3157226 RepID=UPI0033332055